MILEPRNLHLRHTVIANATSLASNGIVDIETTLLYKQPGSTEELELGSITSHQLNFTDSDLAPDCILESNAYTAPFEFLYKSLGDSAKDLRFIDPISFAVGRDISPNLLIIGRMVLKEKYQGNRLFPYALAQIEQLFSGQSQVTALEVSPYAQEERSANSASRFLDLARYYGESGFYLIEGSDLMVRDNQQVINSQLKATKTIGFY